MPKGCLNLDLDRMLLMAEKSDPIYLKILYVASAPEVRAEKCMARFLKIKKGFKKLHSCLLIMHGHLWPSHKTLTIYSFAVH